MIRRWGHLALALGLGLCVPARAVAGEGEALSVPIRVHEVLLQGIEGLDRKAGPVTVGIPFPDDAAVKEADGRPLLGLEGAGAYQFRTLARWRSGNVRWALADFQADCPAGKTAETVKVVRGTGKSAGVDLAVEKGEVISIDTGALQATVKKTGFNLFESVTVGGKALVGPGSKGIVCTGPGGKAYTGDMSEAIIEENGPARCVIRARGVHHDGDERMLDYTVRMHFCKDKTLVKVVYVMRHSVWDRQRGTVSIKDLSVHTRVKGATKFAVAKPDGAAKGEVGGNERIRFFQGLSSFPYYSKPPGDLAPAGWWIKQGEKELAAGGADSSPDLAWLDLSREDGAGLAVGVRFATATWPKGLRALPDGTISAAVFPEENGFGYRIGYGVHHTVELAYLFHAEKTDVAPVMKAFQYPLLAKCPTPWYNRSANVIHPLPRIGTFEEADKLCADRGWKNVVAKRRARMGPKIYRSWWWNAGGFGNQSDFGLAALVGSLRTDDPVVSGSYFLHAQMRNNFYRDLAVSHDEAPGAYDKTKGRQAAGGKDRGNVRGSPPEWEHVNIYGMPLYYYMTGEEGMRDALLDFGKHAELFAWGGYEKSYNARNLHSKNLTSMIGSKRARLLNKTFIRVWGCGMRNLGMMYELTGDEKYLDLIERNFDALLKVKKGGRQIGVNWERGPVHGGSGEGAGSLKPFMSAMYVFDALAICHEWMPEGPVRERIGDVMEGTVEFVHRETWFDREYKGEKVIVCPYVYHMSDKPASKIQFNVTYEHFSSMVYPYMVFGGKTFGGRDMLRTFEKVAKTDFLNPHDIKGGNFRYVDLPGFTTILSCVLYPREDDVPPEAVADLAVDSGEQGVKLTWTAPADAVRYQIKYAARKIVASLEYDPDERKAFKYSPDEYVNWWTAGNVPDEPAPTPGQKQGHLLKGLKPGKYYVAIRSWDAASNRSAVSNLAKVEVK